MHLEHTVVYPSENPSQPPICHILHPKYPTIINASRACLYIYSFPALRGQKLIQHGGREQEQKRVETENGAIGAERYRGGIERCEGSQGEG